MSRSCNNGAAWSGWEQYTRTAFAMLEHDLGDGWVTKLQLDHKINRYHAELGSIQFDEPQTDGTAKVNAQKYTGDTTSDSADRYLSGPFNLFGREHELVLGGRVVNYHLTGLTPSYKESGRFVPYVGAVYDLDDHFSVYASYTDIFMPQES